MSEIIQKARVLSGFRGDLSGEIYETMVVSEIIKWMKTVQRQEKIYYYRTRSGLFYFFLLSKFPKFTD
jgi:predicted AAA+ superfamily ATPase